MGTKETTKAEWEKKWAEWEKTRYDYLTNRSDDGKIETGQSALMNWHNEERYKRQREAEKANRVPTVDSPKRWWNPVIDAEFVGSAINMLVLGIAGVFGLCLVGALCYGLVVAIRTPASSTRYEDSDEYKYTHPSYAEKEAYKQEQMEKNRAAFIKSLREYNLKH